MRRLTDLTLILEEKENSRYQSSKAPFIWCEGKKFRREGSDGDIWEMASFSSRLKKKKI